MSEFRTNVTIPLCAILVGIWVDHGHWKPNAFLFMSTRPSWVLPRPHDPSATLAFVTCFPVTEEVAGSSPVARAIFKTKT